MTVAIDVCEIEQPLELLAAPAADEFLGQREHKLLEAQNAVEILVGALEYLGPAAHEVARVVRRRFKVPSAHMRVFDPGLHQLFSSACLPW